MLKKTLLFVVTMALPIIGFSQNPTAVDSALELRAITDSPSQSVKIAFNPTDSLLYVIRQEGQIVSVDIESGSKSTVQTSSDHGLSDVQGLDISSEGEIYIVGNQRDEENYTNTGVVMKATKNNGSWSWVTVAETEPWPISNTDFDHVMNELVVGPEGDYLYVNSGSRTDHGEEQAVWPSDNPWGGDDDIPEEGLYPGTREVPLTSAIFKIPADAEDLLLENDSTFLHSNGYVFADGTRNSFGLAFDAKGRLFSADNAGERDDPGEFNWLQEGKHYGFPWRIGGNNTPQQYDDYNPDEDPLLSTESRDAIFNNDPNFPEKPDSLTLTEPILNYGPDADIYRDSTSGDLFDASEQDTAIASFTAHRSASGLVFDNDSVFAGDYNGDAFMLAFTGGNDQSFLLRVMNDPGEDLSHIELTKSGDTFEMSMTTVAEGFLNPIDAEIVGNKIYVLEFRNSWLNTNLSTKIWEVNFADTVVTEDTTDTDIAEFNDGVAGTFKLDQNYPNPFNPTTQISYSISKASNVALEVYDVYGRKVRTLVNNRKQSAGEHAVTFNAESLASGVYFYKLTLIGQGKTLTRKMTLVK